MRIRYVYVFLWTMGGFTVSVLHVIHMVHFELVSFELYNYVRRIWTSERGSNVLICKK